MSSVVVVLFLLIISVVLANAEPNSKIPVVYVIFGQIPDYLLINIELASRNNPVVILCEKCSNIYGFNNSIVSFGDVTKYLSSANVFDPLYVHMSRDHSKKRSLHEKRCIQRWFILKDYLASKSIPMAYFGDGDTAVFADITQVQSYRKSCDAVINVEAQGHNFHWVAAGESSVWSLAALEDFCDFAIAMYGKYLTTLKIKGGQGSSVVDMSILWLWWIAHHRKTDGWESGRPFENFCVTSLAVKDIISARRRFDSAVSFSRQLPLPSVQTKLSICNGLDVVNRTVHDHMHAWSRSFNGSFNLNLFGKGTPYVIGAALTSGGRPEFLEGVELDQLRNQRLYLNSIHYQVCIIVSRHSSYICRHCLFIVIFLSLFSLSRVIPS